jgi:hypothetical protein
MLFSTIQALLGCAPLARKVHALIDRSDKQRLQRIRKRRKEAVLNLEDASQNNLRGQLQILYCLQRIKHANATGLYHWMKGGQLTKASAAEQVMVSAEYWTSTFSLEATSDSRTGKYVGATKLAQTHTPEAFADECFWFNEQGFKALNNHDYEQASNWFFAARKLGGASTGHHLAITDIGIAEAALALNQLAVAEEYIIKACLADMELGTWHDDANQLWSGKTNRNYLRSVWARILYQQGRENDASTIQPFTEEEGQKWQAHFVQPLAEVSLALRWRLQEQELDWPVDAAICYRQGRYEEAAKFYQHWLASHYQVLKAAFDGNLIYLPNVSVADAYVPAAMTAQRNGQYILVPALMLLKRLQTVCCRLYELAVGEDSEQYSQSVHKLAKVIKSMGNAGRAGNRKVVPQADALPANLQEASDNLEVRQELASVQIDNPVFAGKFRLCYLQQAQAGC